LTVSALLAGSVLAGIALARRRQQRRRRSGRRVATPAPPAARLERAYREAAPRADITFLDLALRSLAAVLAEQDPTADADAPDVVGAWLGPEELRLILAEPCPQAAAPYTASDDGLEWVLPADAALPVTADTAGEHLAPFPALASIARAGDEQLLLDLERLGSLEITGHAEQGRNLLRHLAVELGHNVWSDYLEVVLVGFGADLTPINPDRIRHVGTLGEAVGHLQAGLTQTRAALEELQPGSVLQGRVHDVAGDAWMPEVLLVSDETLELDGDGDAGADRAQLDTLLEELSRAGRSTVAVVATARMGRDQPTFAGGGWSVHLDADASCTCRS